MLAGGIRLLFHGARALVVGGGCVRYGDRLVSDK